MLIIDEVRIIVAQIRIFCGYILEMVLILHNYLLVIIIKVRGYGVKHKGYRDLGYYEAEYTNIFFPKPINHYISRRLIVRKTR